MNDNKIKLNIISNDTLKPDQSLLKVALGDPDWLPVVKEEPEQLTQCGNKSTFPNSKGLIVKLLFLPQRANQEQVKIKSVSSLLLLQIDILFCCVSKNQK